MTSNSIIDTEKNTNTAPPGDIQIEILNAKEGGIGLIKLNVDKTLNSLTLGMVQKLNQTLIDWAKNEAISVILLTGMGDKAFCAGGDIQALYQSAINPKDGVCEAGEQFFLEEYQLNYRIHCYDKPIICIANGYVMGGGVGLLAGASHRVVTQTTQIAMPEITIGLYPDVGGTYFLNKIPFNIGYFFALTGAKMNGNDAIFCRLADYSIDWSNTENLINHLESIEWSKDSDENHKLTDSVLKDFAPDSSVLLPDSNVKDHLATLEHICRNDSLCDTIESILNIDDEDKWLARAKSTLMNGSPLSSILIFEQLRRHRYADLQSVFESELILSTNIIRYPEFAEGVRALLIDKDKTPDWKFAHYSQVPSSLIDRFFTAPWEIHPLEGLLN